MQDGYKFIVLYLKMMLTAIKSDGKLLLDADVPYDAETLAIVLDMNIEEVSAALAAFKRFGLIKIKDDVICIPNFEDMVGSETPDAKRMRHKRADKSEHLRTMFEQCSKSAEHCSIDIEKEKEIDKDIDIEIEIERESEKEAGGAHNLAPHIFKKYF